MSKDDWAEARAMREVGKSFGVIAAHFGCAKSLVVRRAKAEKWGDGSDVAAILHRRVTEKVSGVTAEVSADPAKKEEAIEMEAARRAAVIDKHREELEEARVMLRDAKRLHDTCEDRAAGVMMLSEDAGDPEKTTKVLIGMQRSAFERLKAARINADTLALIQESERKAWALDFPIDVTKLTDEQLDALAAGRMP